MAIKKLDLASPIDNFDQRRGGQDLGVDLEEVDLEEGYREKFLVQMKLQQDMLRLQQRKYEFEVQQTYEIDCGDVQNVERN